MPITCNPGQVRKSWKRLQARENRAVKGGKQVKQAKRGKTSLRCQARGKSLWCNTQDKPQVLKAGNNSTGKSAENRAAKFGKQANHEKRGKTSIRHRDRVKKQQTNNQTNKEGGAKKGKRRHECKANFAYECIKRFQNCFLACSGLFFRRGLTALFLTYWMPCSEYRDVQMSLSE